MQITKIKVGDNIYDVGGSSKYRITILSVTSTVSLSFSFISDEILNSSQWETIKTFIQSKRSNIVGGSLQNTDAFYFATGDIEVSGVKYPILAVNIASDNSVYIVYKSGFSIKQEVFTTPTDVAYYIVEAL